MHLVCTLLIIIIIIIIIIIRGNSSERKWHSERVSERMPGDLREVHSVTDQFSNTRVFVGPLRDPLGDPLTLNLTHKEQR